MPFRNPIVRGSRPVCLALLTLSISTTSFGQANGRYNDLDSENPYAEQPARRRTRQAPAAQQRPVRDVVPAETAPTAPIDNSPAAGMIQSLLNNQNLVIGSTSVKVGRLRQLYTLRGFRSYFIQGNTISNLGLSVQDMLANESEYHGFDGRHYFTRDAETRMNAQDLRSLVEAELLLTNGYIELAFNMASGRINPRDKKQNLADIELTPPPPPALGTIDQALGGDVTSMQQYIRSLAPHTKGYVALLKALIALKNAQSWGGWPALIETDTAVLKLGVSHPNVPAVRVRLVDMGALPKTERQNQSQLFDAVMEAGVKRLQKALSKKQDGVIGKDTYQVLAVPLANRIIQTKANLERWRLLPRELGSRFLFVDLGRQELDVMVDNDMPIRMRVIVGKDLNGTPTMIDWVHEVIVNPYWRPPKSIIVKEMIPGLLKDPNYLEDRNIRVLGSQGEIDPSTVNWRQYSLERPPPYEFRQDVGERNALGVLKFSLTNAHAIYMHDTDHKAAFNLDERYLSHGCIRLAKPFDLAAHLLADQGFDKQAIQNAVADKRNVARSVRLTKRMNVYIFGTTMVAHQDGTIAFRNDVYKQDQRIFDAMNGVHSAIPSVQATSVQLERETVRLQPGQ